MNRRGAMNNGPSLRASRFSCLPLNDHFDGTGLTARDGLAEGTLNIWGNSLPAEELPVPGSVVTVGGVPFLFPASNSARGDNLRCRSQRLLVPSGRWDWLHVLCTAERRTEDPLLVEYAEGTTREQWLRVSDFWPETPPRFGELLAFRCGQLNYPQHAQHGMIPSIWAQRIPMTVPTGIRGVQLPENPAMHLFALTLQAQP